MSVPVLTAVTDPGLEATLATAFAHPSIGVTVVRRCVDLADLLAVAGTGAASVVLLSDDLRRLDREALSRLAAARLAVVGLVRPGDEAGERRLRQLGVGVVLGADRSAADIAAALVDAAAGPVDSGVGSRGWSDAGAGAARSSGPVAEQAGGSRGASSTDPDVAEPGRGRVVAVWGPTGAPGRSTVALHVAAEAALLGARVVLIDADPYGGSLATLVGAVDDVPGLAAACRTANVGQLDVPRLASLCRSVSLGARPVGGGRPAGELLLLAGPASASRWAEQRASAVEAVIEMARRLGDLVVVDTGFSLEADEELVYDSLAPRRNGATLVALDAAETVIAVGAADPLSLQRLVRGVADLEDAVPGAQVSLLLNRVRPGGVPRGSRDELVAEVVRHLGRAPVALVPDDAAALDAAVASGRVLAEVAPRSPARQELIALAAQVSGRPVPAERRRVDRLSKPGRLRLRRRTRTAASDSPRST